MEINETFTPELTAARRPDRATVPSASASEWSEVIALLDTADAELLQLPLDELEQTCHKGEGQRDLRVWPAPLASLFFESDAPMRRSLHYAVETHYGSMMRSVTGDDFWRLSVLAYARVIPLRLGYDESMGHRRSDSFFVAKAVRDAFPSMSASEMSILDVGCGTGELLSELRDLGFTSFQGVDTSPAAVERARARLGHDAPIHCSSLRALLEATPSARYEAVTLCDVIEHLPGEDARWILTGLRKLLCPGGLLLLTTPSAITGPHDLDFLPGRSKPAGLHLHEYRLRELRGVLLDAGYTNVRSHLLTRGLPKGRSSAWALRVKLILEPLLENLPLPLADRLAEALYFRGVVATAL